MIDKQVLCKFKSKGFTPAPAGDHDEEAATTMPLNVKINLFNLNKFK